MGILIQRLKAFLRKISGCQDHNLIMGEIINHAKANKRTAHMTWFDLEDAFGSVSHDLIPICLDRMSMLIAMNEWNLTENWIVGFSV